MLCLNPTASLGGSHALLTVIRNVARSAASVEALALRGRGAGVRTVAPERRVRGRDGLELHGRGAADRVLAAGYRQGLRVAADEPPALTADRRVGRAVAGADAEASGAASDSDQVDGRVTHA